MARSSKVAQAKKTRALALTPAQALPASSHVLAAIAQTDPQYAFYVGLFGATGVALSVMATLSLVALRPAAKAFGDRLASRVSGEELKKTSRTKKSKAARRAIAKASASAIERKIRSSPNAQRAALEGVRRLLDSLAPGVAKPLADLTAEYVNEEKAPDGFFRGTARFLADLTSDEFRAFRILIERMTTIEGIEAADEIVFRYPLGEDAATCQLQYVRRLPPEEAQRRNMRAEWISLGVLNNRDHPHIRHVWRRLKLSGLAEDPPAGGSFGGGHSGPDRLLADALVLRRLRALVWHESAGET